MVEPLSGCADGGAVDEPESRRRSGKAEEESRSSATADDDNEVRASAGPGAGRQFLSAHPLRVWIDQGLCTGDGLCVQYAPEVFEFDIDGLAYVKDGDDELLSEPGARAAVPDRLRLDVLNSAKECPGECIHVVRAEDDREIAGPDA